MRFALLVLLVMLALPDAVEAQSTVTGGKTSVLLDTDALADFGLDVSGVSPEVITPGDLGPDSVAFEITDETTFFYDPLNFTPFGGTIEHRGQVYFDQQFAYGDFSIGFDPARVSAVNSGFFLESTTEGFLLLSGILFDIEQPSSLDAQPNSLTIEANLLISPELADFWHRPNMAGMDVGDALIAATADTNGSRPVLPTSVTPVNGNVQSGSVSDLWESDNEDFAMSRRPADVQPRIVCDVISVSPVEIPTTFDITVEGSVFSRSNVRQTIELFNYNSGTWETVDSRDASRFTDAVVTASPGGDLSRFVESGTRSIQARIRLVASGQRSRFSSNTDQFYWTID